MDKTVVIKNMQIVNHVRDDGWQIHAIFNMSGWGGWPLQLVSHRSVDEWIVKGMSGSAIEGGTCGFIDLNEQITEAAVASYDRAMTEIFGEDWFKVEDGRTRVMEWRGGE